MALHVHDPVHANTPGEERTCDWKVSWAGWREEVSGRIKFVLWRMCTRAGDGVTNAPGRPGRRERHSGPRPIRSLAASRLAAQRVCVRTTGARAPKGAHICGACAYVGWHREFCPHGGAGSLPRRQK